MFGLFRRRELEPEWDERLMPLMVTLDGWFRIDKKTWAFYETHPLPFGWYIVGEPPRGRIS